MKILLSYVLLASVGLLVVYPSAKAQDNTTEHVVPLLSLPLEDTDFSIASRYLEPVTQTIPDIRIPTQSLIYLAKISEAIDAAINVTFYEKYWKSEVRISSNSDLDKLLCLSYQTTHFRYAPLSSDWMTVLRGSHKFSPNAKAFIKLPYRIKGIGEYRHQWVDGTFAVFR